MLNQRAHILFDTSTYNTLKHLSKTKNASIGELIRRAVKKTYQTQQVKLERVQTLSNIKKLKNKIDTKDINYGELIEDGRKY